MKIAFNNLSFIRNNNISPNMTFRQNSVNNSGKIQQYKTSLNSPETYEQDKLLGREIQKLRKSIIDIKKTYNNTSDLERKNQLSQEIKDLQEKKAALVEELVIKHLPFATKIASDDFFTETNRSEWDDIISYARIGMLRSAERFNPDENPNVYFTSYAIKAIKNEIVRGLNKNKQVYIPIKTVNFRKDCEKRKILLNAQNDRELSDEELAKELGIKDVKKLKEILNSKVITTSLDAPIAEDTKMRFENFYSDDPKNGPSADIEKAEAQEQLKLMIKEVLTPQEALIITLRYKLNDQDSSDFSLVRLETIGKILNLTTERIRQIEERALKKLNRAAKKYDLH